MRLLAALLLGLTATSAPRTEHSPLEIGVVYWSMNIAGQVAMRRGLEQEAVTLRHDPSHRPIRLTELVGGDGQAGVDHQLAEMDQLEARKPDAIILQPIDSAALSGPVLRANRAGIPVVAYDQYVLHGHLACFLASNNLLAGHLDGEYLANRFRGRSRASPLRLAIVEYPYVSSTVDRVDGLLDALTQAKLPYRIVGRYEAVEPVAGAAVGRALLHDHPAGTLDAVFCINDGGGLAVADAFERAHRHDTVFATIDGDPRAVASIRRGGAIAIDTAQFCGPLGAESLRWTYALLAGKPVPRQVLLTVFPVTRENLGAYPGWMGPIPARIRKPWPPHDLVPGTQVDW
ncbi:MAG: D-ribose periplasmic binding protein precursor [Cyanobacteria bacterium RYN_339]|nr:D-ribose periplasmic binding protein precursor [Cyanobacteria bacterium RYN_339]